MLNFTSGKLHRGEFRHLGQFNGRFLYRASLDATPLDPTTFAAFRNGYPAAFDEESLAHEFLHWIAFKCSPLGVRIVGWRFRARKAFMKGATYPVRRYYAARTCFFLAAYDAHEAVVKALDAELKRELATATTLTASALMRRLGALKVARELRDRLANADARAAALMEELGAVPTPLEAWLDNLRGRLATRELGLQNYRLGPNGTATLHETSMLSPTGGIINAAFETPAVAPPLPLRAIKKLRRWTNTERAGESLTADVLARWTILKAASEVEAVRALYAHHPGLFQGHDSPDAFYCRKVKESIDFVRRHTLEVPNSLRASNMVEAILEAAEFADPSRPDDPYVRNLAGFPTPVLYFFYNHGN